MYVVDNKWLSKNRNIRTRGYMAYMDHEITFEERRARQGPPLALADRIERFGRALNARQLAALLAVSTIAIYKHAKAGRIPSLQNWYLSALLS